MENKQTIELNDKIEISKTSESRHFCEWKAFLSRFICFRYSDN